MNTNSKDDLLFSIINLIEANLLDELVDGESLEQSFVDEIKQANSIDDLSPKYQKILRDAQKQYAGRRFVMEQDDVTFIKRRGRPVEKSDGDT